MIIFEDRRELKKKLFLFTLDKFFGRVGAHARSPQFLPIVMNTLDTPVQDRDASQTNRRSPLVSKPIP